jgi:hypothetical protein
MSSLRARYAASDAAQEKQRASRRFSEDRAFCAKEAGADYKQAARDAWEYSVPVERSKDQTHLRPIADALENNAQYLRHLARSRDVRVPVADPTKDGPLPSVQEIRECEDTKMLQILARCGVGV